jgi:hypothetical protein
MLKNGMLQGRLMNSVKVKKSELLTTLKLNLKHHQIDVEEALILRHTETREYFESKLDSLTKNPDYQIKERITFPIPEDNSKEYEKVIRMVEMTQDDIIELDESQFDMLVMDNWGFKNTLIQTSAFYGKSM